MNIKVLEDRLVEKLHNYIDNMDIDNYIELWNTYCRENYDDSRVIYYMSDIDEKLKNLTVSEVIEDCVNISLNDLYYYGDYEYYSTSDIYDVCDDCELIQAIIDDMDSYGDDEIEKILYQESED